ncbi:MAG: HPP family protein [Dehalococcoidales bacterium]|jgi:CBS-domain-containing membrane protein|nr:HPP family protein [Dehalococcoidales bacterium]
MYLIDKSFKKTPKHYIRQSLLAALVVGLILYIFKFLSGGIIIVAALGASTFIVFAMPDSITAQPRRLIGGHAVGLLSGTFAYFVLLSGHLNTPPVSQDTIFILAGALSVGLSIFLMTITNTEHPPAATTAIGIITNGWSFKVALFVLLSALCLALARRALRPHLKDLF